MQMISKRSSGIKLVEEPSFLSIFLKFQNPPLKFVCNIFERHLHIIIFCFVALRPKATAMVIAGRYYDDIEMIQSFRHASKIT